MQTFLQIVAGDIYRRFDGHFERVTIVFPNKRASLFFNQHLADLSDRPLWAPRYVTISELFQSFSQLTVADPIQLVCMLFQAYQQTTGGQTDETLDQFWSWGELMLSDFQDIDNNRVDASQLFTNISDLDDLTRIDYLSEEQIEAIQQFFPNFHESTELQERFFSIWKLLLPTYQRFRAMLLEQGIAYEGMMKREVIESHSVSAAASGSSVFCFVGFNVLNETERSLFRQLRQEAETLFYWDYDQLYVNPKAPSTTPFEAGRFIEQNIRDFGNDLPEPDIYDNFTRPKQIHFIASPTENAQTRHAGSLLQELKREADAALGTSHSSLHAPTDTAVVLCNEAMLQPMLHAIPQGTEVNITMGFPLAGTPISSLLLTLLDLQLHGLAQKGRSAEASVWRYSYVAAVLKHPYTLLMTGEAGTTLLSHLRTAHIFYPTHQQLAVHDYLQTVFTPCQNVGELLTWLLSLVEQIGRNMKDEPLGTESVFDAYTLLSRLQRIHEQGLLNIMPITLQRLILQIIKAKTIPFHGEPAVGLQVMGILETRNLDFRNVLMLSVGEGNLPQQTNPTSFIPYNLREAYGMTTIERKTSLAAYYFYRLLQRAENIWLYYNNSTEGTAKGEMSRFMMQLLTDPRFAHIQQHLITAEYTPQTPIKYEVAKTPELLERMHTRFSSPSILSPSALNSYLDCPLQFYLHYIGRLYSDDEITEEVGNDLFGTIFHYCMEHIYKHRLGLGREILTHELYAMAEDTEQIRKLVDEAFNVEFFKRPDSEKHHQPNYNGEQILNREVLVRYVADQLRFDAQLCPMQVLGTEQHVELPLQQPLDSSVPQPADILLGGTIDRIDLVTLDGQRQLRIVDYKTSNKEQNSNDVAALFAEESNKRSHHILQAFYYADIYTTLHPDHPVAPSLMYVKLARSKATPNLKDSVVTLGSKKNNNQIFVTDFASQCKEDYHNLLTDVIRQMFDPDIPFTQAKDDNPCQWCDYAQLCGRMKSEK